MVLLSSSCSRSLYSSTIMMVINLHGERMKMIKTLFHGINLFYWLNITNFLKLCTVRRWPMAHSANFSHATLGPPARMKHSRKPRMGSLR
jgi:hypothetical protein